MSMPTRDRTIAFFRRSAARFQRAIDRKTGFPGRCPGLTSMAPSVRKRQPHRQPAIIQPHCAHWQPLCALIVQNSGERWLVLAHSPKGSGWTAQSNALGIRIISGMAPCKGAANAGCPGPGPYQMTRGPASVFALRVLNHGAQFRGGSQEMRCEQSLDSGQSTRVPTSAPHAAKTNTSVSASLGKSGTAAAKLRRASRPLQNDSSEMHSRSE